MTTVDQNVFNELQQRDLVAQTTHHDTLQAHLASGSRTLYCGFDPTADSLHIGSLVPLLNLRRFQLAGHKPLALVGGATGLIGDPSAKAQERSLNTTAIVAQWTEQLTQQISRFLDFDSGCCQAAVINNLDWLGGRCVLHFLRDIGKHFPVNVMVKKESVKQRLDREGEGISFTEFSYMILQSLDFAELYQRHNCTLQIGGSDQWGNITGGVELTRRLHHATVFGLTSHLITQADGSKFGKTEAGTVWLDPQKTSPYRFYQFWLQTADQDVYRFLRYFTFLSLQEINNIEQQDRQATGRPQAHLHLARAVTQLTHGVDGLQAAQRITDALFNGSIEALSEHDFQQLRLDGLPSTSLSRAQLKNTTLTQLLSECGVVNSGKQAKDALSRQALWINHRSMSLEDNTHLMDCLSPEHAFFHRYHLVQVGKKTYHLFDIDPAS